MTVSNFLLELIVCPACKGELDYQREAELLVCQACKRAYPIEDDIPHLMVEESPVLEE